MDENRRHFLLRRLHSLTGVLPLTVFILEHFLSNSTALLGAEHFNRIVELYASVPYFLGAGEVLIVIAPILFHGIYGMRIAAESSVNAVDYPHARNLMYVLQRLSGVIIFAFVLYHFWNTRAQAILFDVHIDYNYMASYFAAGWVKAVYLVGVLATVFHLSNGLWTFAITWGLATTPGGQRNFFYVCMALGAGLALMGARLVWAFQP